MPKLPPFSGMLRACFWLLAAVVGTELVITASAALTCFTMLLGDQAKIGACGELTQAIKSIWADVLAAILALLLAARSGNGDSDK